MKKYLNFEQLNKTEAGKLLGGFSQTFSADTDDGDDGANNCKHGNCKKGCHHKYTPIKIDSTAINNCGAGKNCSVSCSKQKKKK